MFEALLEAKADVNAINGDGASALHLTAASDSARSFEMFETLLKAGADLKLDVQDSMGETLMAAACRVGNFEVFEALLKAGADVNVVRRDGKSALQLAIVWGKGKSFEMFEALLEAKADVNVQDSIG
jgi:ankyrin repeat protein